MKTEEMKKNLVYRNIAGEHILVPVGESALAINGLFLLNDLGMEIWKLLCDGKNKEEIAVKLLADYDVEEAVLRKDVECLYQNLVFWHVLDE